MLGMATVLGGILLFLDAEVKLVKVFAGLSSSPEMTLSALGGVSITAAHGHAMAMLGNARRKYGVPLPTVAAFSNIPFWNANRGYYNMVEHLPFFLFNVWLARESGFPCVAGTLCVVWGIGRIMYTHGYAYNGPSGRVKGYMVATMASMACLGVALIRIGFNTFK